MISGGPQAAEPLEPLESAIKTDTSSQLPLTTELQQQQQQQQQQTPMSKNALKRLRKQKEWEEGRPDRRLKRREKRQAHKIRVRAERAAAAAAAAAAGADPSHLRRPPPSATSLVPVSIVVDCDFEPFMTDKERISLSSQVTRVYSDNRSARFRSHLWIAGFRGRLRDRFDNVLQAQYRNWRGASVFSGDFLACAVEARAQMARIPTVTPSSSSTTENDAAAAATTTTTTQEGGEEQQQQQQQQQQQTQQLIEPLQYSLENPSPWTRDPQDPFPLPDPEPPLDAAYGDVVYLTSDSPYTLERLEPYTTYVVGGLVDKNREKGLCYRRARERGVRTARLPIARFMVMQSRQVLATNHVVDILLKWLQLRDWGKAFLSVIPKRKGGRLRGGVVDGELGEDGHVDGESESESETEAGDHHHVQNEAEAEAETEPETRQGQVVDEMSGQGGEVVGSIQG